MSNTAEPLKLDIRGDAWWVYFDTPDSAVNIVTKAAAEAVLELSETARREGPETVVFASAKSKSFINGAQLMMASAVQSCEDVFPLTELLRRTYRAVRELEMLTVAAVEGSCYGCGVEFALNCDHRLVADSGHTQFYMTELADYLNTPAFGSTQRLVRKMPLPAAVDFLMWGRRLRADKAVADGLASAALPWQGFEDNAGAIIEDILAGRFEPPSVDWLSPEKRERYEDEVWRAIDGLPKQYRQIHRDCFRLMLHAKTKPTFDAEDEKLELEACGRSLVEPAASKARSVLFVRQLAERACLRQPPAPRDLAFVLDPNKPELADLRRELVDQNHPRSRVVDTEKDIDGGVVSFSFHPLDAGGQTSETKITADRTVASSAGIAARPVADRPTVVFHRPAPGLKDWDESKLRPRGGATMLVELALDDRPDETTDLLFDYLSDFDAAVLYTRPTDHFACDVLAMAYLAPLVTFIARGGSVSTVERSLHHFGFLQMPRELSEAVEPTPELIEGLYDRASTNCDRSALRTGLDSLLSGGDGGSPEPEPEPTLVDALLLSLLEAVDALLNQDVLAHPALADVITCELIGFPIARGTLCQFGTPDWVTRALTNPIFLENLLSPKVLDHAGSVQREQRGHYV